jgi:hypothetical protein
MYRIFRYNLPAPRTAKEPKRFKATRFEMRLVEFGKWGGAVQAALGG